jgi:hypothetical protein
MNAQSRVAGLCPCGYFTIASVGTSWITVPGGSVPPVAERATATVAATSPRERAAAGIGMAPEDARRLKALCDALHAHLEDA